MTDNDPNGLSMTPHSKHSDYSKPEDQCIECEQQKQWAEQMEYVADRNNQAIDDAIEARMHHHDGGIR